MKTGSLLALKVVDTIVFLTPPSRLHIPAFLSLYLPLTLSFINRQALVYAMPVSMTHERSTGTPREIQQQLNEKDADRIGQPRPPPLKVGSDCEAALFYVTVVPGYWVSVSQLFYTEDIPQVFESYTASIRTASPVEFCVLSSALLLQRFSCLLSCLVPKFTCTTQNQHKSAAMEATASYDEHQAKN